MFALKTDRTLLRALEPEDVATLYEWENDTDTWSVSNTLAPYSKFTFKELVETSQLDLYAARQLRLMIEDRKSRATVGVLDIFEFDPLHLRAGIGILVDKNHRRLGFAEEAVRIATGYLFGHLHLRQVFSHVMSGNPAAVGLFRKCGFRQAGSLKDWVRTSHGFEDVVVMQLFADQYSHE